MAQHPGAALDGAALYAVAAHGVDRSHAEQTTARRFGGQGNFLELVAGDPFQSVVGGEQSVDEDVVTLEQLPKVAVVAAKDGAATS